MLLYAVQADEIEKILCRKFMGFMMRRADNFFILRRKPCEVSTELLLTYVQWRGTLKVYFNNVLRFAPHLTDSLQVDKNISIKR